MKGTSTRLRGSQLSLILILLMCTTIFFWALEKTPHLSSLLPPQNPSLQLLHLSSDIFTPTPVLNPLPSKPKMHVGRYKSKFTKKEKLLDQVAPVIINNSPFDKRDNLVRPPEKEATGKKNLKAEKKSTSKFGSANSELERRYMESVRKVISEKRTSTNAGSKRPSTLIQPTNNTSSSSSSVMVENQGCNYAKGKWVVDKNRPLYSGFNCKQWLSGMWSCRLTQRTDFSYEKLRWQPKDCKMEEFDGDKFLSRMQGKTLAFVGDSLGRQQFQSLMCMLTGGKHVKDVIDVGIEYGLGKPNSTKRPDGWAYRFTRTNTSILYYWSACLCDLQPVDIRNPKTDHAMHLDRPPAFLRRYLHKISILVLNTGHHWNRGKLRANRWVMHVGGVPNKDKRLAPLASARNFTIHNTVQWVDSQLRKHPGKKVFYRSISPRHFANGEWNTGGSCNNTTPMSIGKQVVQEESSDVSAASAVKGTRVKLLDITALSNLRDEGHMSRFSINATPGVQDCLHWCLPGVPDTWNEILLTQI